MKVMLTKEIRFTGFAGEQVVLREGTFIYVDMERQIGCIHRYHFDIDKTEYTLAS